MQIAVTHRYENFTFLCIVLLLAISEPAAAQQRRDDHNTQLGSRLRFKTIER